MTEALPDAVKSARDVAVIVMTFDCGALAGAKYTPVLVIWPQALPLHVVPLRLQMTTLFEVPVTVGTNWAWPPGWT
jgi:hypothetical protein